MNGQMRAAILTSLADKLVQHGSWCGETHLQKATYLLQELFGVPTDFDFILYKHGPFSFELRDELTALRADELLKWELMPYPYGPKLVPSDLSNDLRAALTEQLSQYENALERVALIVDGKGVVELERLATAIFVTREMGRHATVEERTVRLHNLKPHVTFDAANAAIIAIDGILSEV